MCISIYEVRGGIGCQEQTLRVAYGGLQVPCTAKLVRLNNDALQYNYALTVLPLLDLPSRDVHAMAINFSKGVVPLPEIPPLAYDGLIIAFNVEDLGARATRQVLFSVERIAL